MMYKFDAYFRNVEVIIITFNYKKYTNCVARYDIIHATV